jgi:serine/threonine-protein kinase
MGHPHEFGEMSNKGWNDFQTYIDNYKAALRADPDAVDIIQYLPPQVGELRQQVLYELVKEDLEYRWSRDKPLPVDEYLRRYPELGTRETVPAELLLEEVRQKKKHGWPIKLETYHRDYPNQYARLQKLIDEELGGLTVLPASSPAGSGRSSRPSPGKPRAGALARDYKLIEKIGSGSYAEVWLAQHVDSGKEVAVKWLRESKAEKGALELTKKLRHLHLADYHVFWEVDGDLWVVMDHADGGTLKDRLAQRKKQGRAAIPVEEALRYMEQIAAAIDYLHAKDDQHRDIKPANILLFGADAKLADLGLAKQMADKDFTHTEGGTPLYQAPEMFDGKLVKRLSDQYCFAFTFAELMLGEPPFKGSLFQIMESHKKHTADLRPLPELIQRVMLKALAKEPTDRFASCTEFVAELREAVRECRKLGLPLEVASTAVALEAVGAGSAHAGSATPPVSGSPAPAVSFETPPSGAGVPSVADSVSWDSTLRIGGSTPQPASTPHVERTLAPPPATPPEAPTGKVATDVPSPAATPPATSSPPPAPAAVTPPRPAATPDKGQTAAPLSVPAARSEAGRPAATERIAEQPQATAAVPAHPAAASQSPPGPAGVTPVRGPAAQSKTPSPGSTPVQKPSETTPPDPTSTIGGARSATDPRAESPKRKSASPSKASKSRTSTASGKIFEIEDYSVDSNDVIGEGGGGTVYEATHKKTGEKVALKRLNRSMFDVNFTRLQEQTKYSNRSLVRVLKVILDDRHDTWIVMELADGGSLDQWLTKPGKPPCKRLPPGELLQYIEDVASGLQYLHDRHISHRDVKPENIVLCEGVAKLTDFDLLRVNSQKVSQTLRFAGTWQYAPPEFLDDQVNVWVGPSDLYSLAMTYAVLRRDEHPYAPYLGNIARLQQAVLHDKPDLSGIPAPEQKVLRKALAKNPADRFQTCGEFIRALKGALAVTEPGEVEQEDDARRSVWRGDDVKQQEQDKESGWQAGIETKEPSPWGGMVATLVLLALVIGVGWWWLFKPALTAPAIMARIDSLVSAESPDFEAASREAQSAAALEAGAKEEVEKHFFASSRKRIDQIIAAQGFEEACAQAARFDAVAPDQPRRALDDVGEKWLSDLRGRLGKRDPDSVDELLAWKKQFPAKQAKELHADVEATVALMTDFPAAHERAKRLDAAFTGLASVGSVKTQWLTAARAGLTAGQKSGVSGFRAYFKQFPGEKPAESDQKLLAALVEVDLSQAHFSDAFKTISAQADLWDDKGENLRKQAGKRVVDYLEGSKKSYAEIARLDIAAIFKDHLAPAQQDKVRPLVRAAYGRQVHDVLADLNGKGHDVRAKSLAEAQRIADEHRLDFGSALDEETLYLTKHWKCIHEIDGALKKVKGHKPLAAADMFCELVKARQESGATLSLDEPAAQVAKLAESYPEVKDRLSRSKDELVKPAGLDRTSKAQGAMFAVLGMTSVPRGVDAILKQARGACLDAKATIKDLLLTRNDVKDIQDDKKLTPAQKSEATVLVALLDARAAQSRGAYETSSAALVKLLKDQAVPTDYVPPTWRILDDVQKQHGMTLSSNDLRTLQTALKGVQGLKDEEKTEMATRLGRLAGQYVAGIYVDDRAPPWTTDAKEWADRLDVCQMCEPISVRAAACRLEAWLEVLPKDAHREKEWASTLKALTGGRPSAGEAERPYVEYVYARARAAQGDSDAAATDLVTAQADLKGLHQERRKILGKLLRDACGPIEPVGLKKPVFKSSQQAGQVYARLTLARELGVDASADLTAGLVLAAAEMAPAKKEVVREHAKPWLKLEASSHKAWLPVVVAYLAAIEHPIEKLQVYSALAREFKKDRKILSDAEFEAAVLTPALAAFPPARDNDPVLTQPPADEPGFEPKKSLAAIVALDAELKRPGNPGAAKMFDLYRRASELDPANADYVFDKARIRVELPDFNRLRLASWRELDEAAERAAKDKTNLKGQWLYGWVKLHQAMVLRFEDAGTLAGQGARERRYEEAKLAWLRDSEAALIAAEKIKPADASGLAEICLHISQAALEQASYYEQVVYDGQRTRLDASAKIKTYLAKALTYAEQARSIAEQAGPDQVPRPLLASIYEAVGQALEGTAREGGAKSLQEKIKAFDRLQQAIKAFERALELNPDQVTAKVGKGRALYYHGAYGYSLDKELALSMFAQAKEELTAARQAYGDSMAAAEALFFLGRVAWWRSDPAKPKSLEEEPKCYEEAIRLFEKHKATNAAPAVHPSALEYVKQAINKSFEREQRKLDKAAEAQKSAIYQKMTEYAARMKDVDASEGARLNTLTALYRVAPLQADTNKLVDTLDQLIGKDHGPLQSELLLVKWTYESTDPNKYFDTKKKDVHVKDAATRSKLLALFDRNIKGAPNDYVKAWSLLYSAEIGYYSDDDAGKVDALRRYEEGLKIAEDLIYLHDGIGSIGVDRPSKKFYDSWTGFDMFYQGAARLALGLATASKDPKKGTDYLDNAGAYLSRARKVALEKSAERSEALDKLEKEIEDERRRLASQIKQS